MGLDAGASGDAVVASSAVLVRTSNAGSVFAKTERRSGTRESIGGRSESEAWVAACSGELDVVEDPAVGSEAGVSGASTSSSSKGRLLPRLYGSDGVVIETS
jgi:hypothetical protein